jgi:3-oxoadipate enol-lactonase
MGFPPGRLPLFASTLRDASWSVRAHVGKQTGTVMRTKTRGFSTGYDDSGGDGVPLVLIHGFPLNRTIWAAQVKGLAGAARVIAPDLRGFGETTDVPEDPAITGYADDVRDLLDALGVERAVIGGVSMGGYVALAFGRKFPKRMLGLILVDTRAGADSSEARVARDNAASLAKSRGASAIAVEMLPKMITAESMRGDDALRSTLLDIMSSQPVPAIVAALRALRDRPDASSSLAKIAVPTLVICGSQDTLIPPAESVALKEGIRGAQLVKIGNAAHLPNFEQPTLFNRAVRSFVKGLDA